MVFYGSYDTGYDYIFGVVFIKTLAPATYLYFCTMSSLKHDQKTVMYHTLLDVMENTLRDFMDHLV